MNPERLTHEIRRALEATGARPSGFGLRVRPQRDELVVLDRYGVELCRVPRHRLVEPTSQQISAFVERFYDDVGLRDQGLAAIAAGDWVCCPDNDEVLVRIGGELGLRLDRVEVLAFAGREV